MSEARCVEITSGRVARERYEINGILPSNQGVAGLLMVLLSVDSRSTIAWGAERDELSHLEQTLVVVDIHP